MTTITESPHCLQLPLTLEDALAWQYFTFEKVTLDMPVESPNHWEMNNVSPD